jgi:hypothetical protein
MPPLKAKQKAAKTRQTYERDLRASGSNKSTTHEDRDGDFVPMGSEDEETGDSSDEETTRRPVKVARTVRFAEPSRLVRDTTDGEDSDGGSDGDGSDLLFRDDPHVEWNPTALYPIFGQPVSCGDCHRNRYWKTGLTLTL